MGTKGFGTAPGWVVVGLVACGGDPSKDSSDCNDLAPELCDDGDEGGGSGTTDDTGDGGGSGAEDGTGSGSGSDEPGTIDGDANVLIIDLGCDVHWNLSGTQCDGCSLEWDVALRSTESSTCSFGADWDGRFELTGGAVYFDGLYWGDADAADGNLEFATRGYVYGTAYTYVYTGSATYTVSGGGADGGDGTDGGGTGSGDVGDLHGVAGVWIVETECDVVWTMSGEQCPGCDLGWDTDLELSDAGSCPFGTDTSGTFEVVAGAAYFRGDYWGAAAYGGGSVAWASAGYIYGAGGYTYYYAGSAAY